MSPSPEISTGKNPLPYIDEKRANMRAMIDFGNGGPLPEWPLEVFLEVSNICNLKCAMCPTFSALNPMRFNNLREEDRGLLAIEEVREPLEDILRHALIVHAFGYGEPTIHPQFRDFISYLHQFGVMVDFFSHGMNLTEDLCEFLVSNRVAKITISFSGADAESYENIYIGGNFERVMDGIRRLDRIRKAQGSRYPLINVNSIGFRHHIEQLENFVAMMADAGVDGINVKNMQTYDKIPELHQHKAVCRPEIEGQILQRAHELAKARGIGLNTSDFERNAAPDDSDVIAFLQRRHKGKQALSTDTVPLSALKNLSREKSQNVAPAEDREAARARLATQRHQWITMARNPCFEPIKSFYASFNGEVFPCCFRTHAAEALGNLRTQDGAAIWHGDAFRELREHAVQNEFRSDLCSQCIKTQSAPVSHLFKYRFQHYRDWVADTYQLRTFQSLLAGAARLPDNATSFAWHRNRNRLLDVLQSHGFNSHTLPMHHSLGELVAQDEAAVLATLQTVLPEQAALEALVLTKTARFRRNQRQRSLSWKVLAVTAMFPAAAAILLQQAIMGLPALALLAVAGWLNLGIRRENARFAGLPKLNTLQDVWKAMPTDNRLAAEKNSAASRADSHLSAMAERIAAANLD